MPHISFGSKCGFRSLNLSGLMEYPWQDRAGRAVDQRLELLKRIRRDHRTARTIANRILIGLGLRHVEKRMQHDVPPEGLAKRNGAIDLIFGVITLLPLCGDGLYLRHKSVSHAQAYDEDVH